MKVIVAGGRKLSVTDSAVQGVIRLLREIHATEVVSGGAPGGDQIGEIAGRRLDLPIKVFEADWQGQGRSAGPIRNQSMVAYAGPSGACVLLPGGKGTEDMERRAREKGMAIFKIELIHEKSETADLYDFKRKRDH